MNISISVPSSVYQQQQQQCSWKQTREKEEGDYEITKEGVEEQEEENLLNNQWSVQEKKGQIFSICHKSKARQGRAEEEKEAI